MDTDLAQLREKLSSCVKNATDAGIPVQPGYGYYDGPKLCLLGAVFHAHGETERNRVRAAELLGLDPPAVRALEDGFEGWDRRHAVGDQREDYYTIGAEIRLALAGAE